MLKNIMSMLSRQEKDITLHILKGRQSTSIQCKVGSNLMDVTNSIVNQNVNIYGLCDKQLACTTCRVDIEKKYEVVPAASDEEMDVLLTTKHFNERTSRMACQIHLSEEMDGMEVRIPENNASKGM